MKFFCKLIKIHKTQLTTKITSFTIYVNNEIRRENSWLRKGANPIKLFS
jgi:hypothetical protein